jgi:outer membrane receptor protein involved in Fe transport
LIHGFATHLCSARNAWLLDFGFNGVIVIRTFALSALALTALFTQHLIAQNTGTITGTVFDGANGQPVRQADVSLKEKPEIKTVSDTDGRFVLTAPVGSYTLLVKSSSFIDTSVEAVVVEAGKAVEASTVMTAKGQVTSVDVVEKVGAVAANAEAMLTERKLASVVSDAISGDEIRKSVASDAAGALEKVTGVSIVDSGYVYVRGLGERYSSTMLNNAMIPTTEPERRVVPLDLFPAALIDNIKILKTYSPDLPGEFSGGTVQMRTVEFPTKRILRFSATYGFNSVTTGKRFGSYPGGGLDAFGFEDGTRALPGIIPTNQRLIVGRFNEQQFQTFGRAFSTNWTPTPINSMRPNQSYSISGGDSFFGGRLGIVAALTFANTPQRTDELQRYLRTGQGGRPLIFSDYTNFQVNNESARLGTVLNVSWKIRPAHKLTFRNTITRDTDKEARVFTGLNGGLDSVIEASRLRWVERSINSLGVEGEHSFTKLANSLFTWQFTYSKSGRYEPDMRETIRGREESGVFSYLPVPDSGIRLFTNLSDRIYEPLAEWGTPFFKGKVSGMVKFGFRGTLRSRDFEARRFRFVPVRPQTLNYRLPTNELFAPSNIRPDGFAIREITRGTDTYDASTDIFGGFALIDLALGGKWRVITGVRMESADIQVNTIDPLVPGARPAQARLQNTDPLPSVNVIYALTSRQNLRFGWGRTVNRPDFRELSPFEFTNVLGGYATAGNPLLQRARIDNFDGRWEWFLGGDQVIAASFFYKKFENPIESIFTPTTAELRQSFVNAQGANNMGVELEYRRSLKFLTPKMADFSAQANFTFVDSDVQLPNDRTLVSQLTSLSRPLMGQSRYIYNVILDWNKPRWRSNARFFVNSVSRRITDVGTFRLPDIYQERNTFLDFSYQYDLKENGRWSVRFTAENLTDNQYRWTQGDILQRAFRIGRTFTVGTSFSLF